ncbi:MAG: hypothetical protein QN122_05385 [Armatimonadota bacterium]|nr:hypothetical protein [Armatimonadota bacterium]MDR7490867.1 hypothetical protein [Armatimonadota bacterium]MDR7501713.1 hypothetical protein [Armatimonadota bacterium]MDR7527372.1 hypothetical protein [Armatimonadota bacterium]MDR7585158.1 hypothetical protein [Armatimonadota bacterium]
MHPALAHHHAGHQRVGERLRRRLRPAQPHDLPVQRGLLAQHLLGQLAHQRLVLLHRAHHGDVPPRVGLHQALGLVVPGELAGELTA